MKYISVDYKFSSQGEINSCITVAGCISMVRGGKTCITEWREKKKDKLGTRTGLFCLLNVPRCL